MADTETKETAMVTYHYNGKQIDLKLNGTDEPNCPLCNRYNAMLFERMCNGPRSDDYVLKCRDCGAEVIVLTTMKATTWTSTFIELNGI